MDRFVTDTAGLHAAAWQNLFEQPERGKQTTPSSSALEYFVYADAISTQALLTRMSMVPAVSLAAANWAAASCRVGSAEKTAAVQAPPGGARRRIALALAGAGADLALAGRDEACWAGMPLVTAPFLAVAGLAAHDVGHGGRS